MAVIATDQLILYLCDVMSNLPKIGDDEYLSISK